jgi:hypothetical protein
MKPGLLRMLTRHAGWCAKGLIPVRQNRTTSRRERAQQSYQARARSTRLCESCPRVANEGLAERMLA